MDSINQGIPGRYKYRLNETTSNTNSLKESEVNPRNIQRIVRRKSFDFSGLDCCRNTHQHFQSFADNASIDGIKFVTEKNRTIPERIFWIVTLIVALYFCIVLVIQTFEKWINSPIIVTFATSETPIFQVPFPAITICPEVKSDRLVFNYTDIYLRKQKNETVTELDEISFNYMSLICGSPNYLLRNDDRKINDTSPIIYFMLVSTEFDTSIFQLEWRGEIIQDANDLFTPIVTSEGICYTFNIMDRSEIFTDNVSYPSMLFSTGRNTSMWFPETGYSAEADIDSYPKRTFVAGTKGGLKITLIVSDDDLDYVCGDSLQGFKVCSLEISVHNPGEIPRVDQNYFRLPLEQSITASIKPNMMTTSEDLRTYSPKDRKCYFAKERKLKFFKIYNQQNCLMECLTNFTMKSCGCVNFYMPRVQSMPICNAFDKECMDNAQVLFLASEVKYKIKQIQNRKSERDSLHMQDSNYTDSCDCLPSCVFLDYDVATSQSNWNWFELFHVLRQTNQWDEDLDDIISVRSFHFSRMTIFFKEMQFITSQRNEWQGYTDFWSNIGGIIGLFTGFSFITMFEILYYLSLRIFCNVRMFGKQYWSGLPKE